MKWWVSNDSTKQAIRTDNLPPIFEGKFHQCTIEEYTELKLYEVKLEYYEKEYN